MSTEVIVAVAERLLVSQCLLTFYRFIKGSIRNGSDRVSLVTLHFEVDQSFSFLNFNLCYLSGLLIFNDQHSHPTTPSSDSASTQDSHIPTDVRK